MASIPLSRQFFNYLCKNAPEISTQQMRVRSSECFNPAKINNLERVNYLLHQIALFREAHPDGRKYFRGQELKLLKRKQELTLKLKQAELF